MHYVWTFWQQLAMEDEIARKRGSESPELSGQTPEPAKVEFDSEQHLS
jgi:hypothetical protein